MAPMISVPSSPRLIRPLFSVMHSPRLTNRNGVLTRIAPPRTATGTPHQPRVPVTISAVPGALKQIEAPDNALAHQQHDENDPLHDQDGRVGQTEPARKHTTRISRPTLSPAMRAARSLPPTMRAANPNVVRSIRI